MIGFAFDEVMEAGVAPGRKAVEQDPERLPRPEAPGDGAVAQVVEVWRDISDRRAAEASMAESHKLASLGLLASGFSHELNTPLATVLTDLQSEKPAVRFAAFRELDRILPKDPSADLSPFLPAVRQTAGTDLP